MSRRLVGDHDEPVEKENAPWLTSDDAQIIAVRRELPGFALESLLQGSWELHHGNEGKGRPNTRSVKTIEGNKETLRRYSIATGKLTHAHSVEFKLSRSGSVRVMTFFRVGGSPEQGLSYVYKVDEGNFWDIPGLLQGGEYRNYQNEPTIWHWKRVHDSDAAESTRP